MDEKEFSDEEREELWQEADKRELATDGRKRLGFLMEEHPGLLRELIREARLWKRMEETARMAKSYREEILASLLESDPPKPGENPEAVRNMHRMMAEERVGMEILYPEASLSTEG